MTSFRSQRAAFALALVVTGLVGGHIAERFHTNTWIFRDGRFYINVNEGLVERGSLADIYAHSWYDDDLGWNHNLPAGFSNIAVGRDGTYYSFRPYLLPLFSTPLYYAFGLLGPLLFNALLFLVIAVFAFRFVRNFTPSDLSAGLATLIFLFGSGVQLYLYDYSVDILLLALLTFSLANAWRGHGARMGVAFALCLVLKPTTLLLAPVVAFPFVQQRNARGVWRALAGGAVVLGLGGLMNTWMFGRPWWFGYHRVLAVENGTPTIVSDTAAFTTPLQEGLRDIWEGDWGVRHRWTAYAAALLGLVALARRHPVFTGVAVLVAAANVVLFAKFQYHDDRYLFPAALVLAPACGAALDATAKAIGMVLRALRQRFQTLGPPLLAAAFVFWFGACTVPFREPLGERLGQDAYVLGAQAWSLGHFDLRGVVSPDRVRNAEDSPITRSRFGHWLPRESPAAVAVAAPFFGIAGALGLVTLHLLAAAWIAFSAARLLRPTARPVIAAWVAASFVLLPPVREGIVTGGPWLLAVAAAAAALERALSARWIAAGVLSVMAAWLADAPWLVALAVFPLAALGGRVTALRCGGAIAATLLLWCLSHLLLIGRPFASPNDFVLFEGVAGFETIRIPVRNSWPAFAAWLTRDGSPRALLPLLLVAPVGLALALRRDLRLVGFAIAIAASFLFPATRLLTTPFLLAFFGLLTIGPLIAVLSSLLERFAGWASSPRRSFALALAALVGLAAVGATRRVIAAREPWRMASDQAVKEARVHLGRFPCDFLAWEHMAWECSHYDRTPYAVTGLHMWHGVLVGGHAVPLFVISSGRRGLGPRRASWSELPAAQILRLRWAVPDGTVGNGVVVVRINGREVDRFEVPESPPGRLETRTVETGTTSGSMDFELEVQGRGTAPTTVAFDGEFVDVPSQRAERTMPAALSSLSARPKYSGSGP